MRTIAAIAVLTGAGLAAHPASAGDADSELWVSGSTGYISGDFGTSERTSLLIAPITAEYRTGAVRITASVPYVSINGEGTVGHDGSPLPGVGGGDGARDGFGDASVAAGVTLPSERLGGAQVSVTGAVKLPTASKEEGLGTGETDYAVGADVAYPLGGWTPFASLSYLMPGDPEGVDLRNSVAASVGASRAAGPATIVASYAYRQATDERFEDAQEVVAGVRARATDRVTIGVFGAAGLTDGAADVGAGLTISARLF